MSVISLNSHESVFDVVETVVQHYAYSAFGKILKISNANGNDISANPVVEPYFTYTGREWDDESGLYYYRARYYSAEIGRFISADPHPGDIRSPITLNRYVYARNNGLSYVDPDGEFAFLAGLAIAAVAGGIYAETQGGNFFEGALIGAATGGVVGGVGSEQTGIGTFREGFTFGANNDNKDKILVLKFTQVSSNYDSFPHKLWMIGTGITLGLVPFHSDVTIMVEASLLGKNGRLIKNYKSKASYDFWVHLFLTPYLFTEHNDKYGRIALRNYLFDKVVSDAKKCGGVPYSVSYEGQQITADLEFKFKFNTAVQARHGNTINLSLGVIAKAMEDASLAGQFNNEQIGNFVKADTYGEADEL